MIKNLFGKARGMIGKYAIIAAFIVFIVVIFSETVLASEATAEFLWETVEGLIAKWVMRLGAVTFFVGCVMFALAWKENDAEQKTRGISTIIAGAMTIAIAALADVFFA